MKNKLMIFLALSMLVLASLACNLGSSDNPPQTAPEQPAAGGSGEQVTGSGDLQMAPQGQVEVTLGDSRITQDGVFIYTAGTVVNKTNRPISAHILIEYLDASGNPIDVTVLGEQGKVDSTTAFAPIAPGQTGYFDRIRDISKLSTKPASARVRLDYAVMEKKSPLAAFSNTSWEVKDETLYLSGKVANTGDAACRTATVVGVLMQGGKAVGVSTVLLSGNELAAGASQDFSGSEITDFMPKFDDVKFVIDCSFMSFER
jgi:hypothetical protein